MIKPAQEWICNEDADYVVLEAQSAIKLNKNDPSIFKLMDMISSVPGYQITNPRRQGYIKKTYIRLVSRGRANASNFTVDFEDVVSAFWQEIFIQLPNATVTGSDIDRRLVKGQLSDDDVHVKRGITYTKSNTKCNPINFLRNRGKMAIRNLINKVYKKSLIQVCDDCGVTSNTSSAEIETDCPQCNSSSTNKHWVDNKTTYGSPKLRTCDQCDFKWRRKFVYTCTKCKSINVRIETKILHDKDNYINNIPVIDEPDEDIIRQQFIDELDDILENIWDFLPANPGDAKAVSKTKEVYNILTGGRQAYDICTQCKIKSPQVCSVSCDNNSCWHPRMPDPKICCNRNSFSLEQCINSNKKISEYHSCSPALTARRVKKVRTYIVRYLKQNQANDTCRSIYEALNNYHILDKYV